MCSLRRLLGLWPILAALFSPLAGAESSPHAVIFMYHRFGEHTLPSTNVTMAQFAAQMDYLERADFQVWPLEKIVNHLKNSLPIPQHTVAITVDDAYISVYRRAFPLLREKGWPFTVFVSTESVDQGRRAYMTWAQMREMARHGVTFANHSKSHAHLIERRPDETQAAWRQRVHDDIVEAEKRITAELGIAAKLFAYPYGEYNDALAELVTELGYTAFGQQSGAAGVYDLRALPRYPISEAYGDLSEFRVKASSLPLPVIAVTPWDPQIEGATLPGMSVTLGVSDARLEQLSCYVSGQGVVPVQWQSRQARRFSVTAAAPLIGRRGRYNCTAPSAQGDYYWYSHLWINSRHAED